MGPYSGIIHGGGGRLRALWVPESEPSLMSLWILLDLSLGTDISAGLTARRAESSKLLAWSRVLRGEVPMMVPWLGRR